MVTVRQSYARYSENRNVNFILIFLMIVRAVNFYAVTPPPLVKIFDIILMTFSVPPVPGKKLSVKNAMFKLFSILPSF